ncbi:MAG: ABC transporter substrate-binding protein, partial [Terrimicrobium sp.]
MKNFSLFFAVLTLAVVVGCGGGSSSAKIGLNVELTGEMPAVGASAKNAAEMFVNEVNKAGGLEVAGKKLPLTLVIGDNAAKADQAAAVA